jgi:hypothetical protein
VVDAILKVTPTAACGLVFATEGDDEAGLFAGVWTRSRGHAREVRSLGKSGDRIGHGAWPSGDHVDVDAVNDRPRREFRQKIGDAGDHQRAVVPATRFIESGSQNRRRAVPEASASERLEVPVVVTFSGCPETRDRRIRTG